MKALPFFLLFFSASIAFAQVAFVEKDRAADFKNSSSVYVMLASEQPRTVEKLARNAALAEAYRQAVADFNTNLREVFAAQWTLNAVQFKTRAEMEKLREDGANPTNTFVIATGDTDEMLAETALQKLKKKADALDFDKFLVNHDEQGSLDIFALSQWKNYWTPREQWAMQQEEKMKMDKKLGKMVLPGDYLKHRALEFVGFFLSQHAVLTRSDLSFGLHYMHTDLTAASTNTRGVQVNQPVLIKGADMSKKTLLVGRDLVTFPNGKKSLGEKKIIAVYPHPFKIVGQSEIEKALASKSTNVMVIIPVTRWSATGYPELLMFYVVDAANGRTVLTYADTGSGSNPMTANNFERSAELKAKHFQEMMKNGEK
ncbi:MAG: hypothetical protein ACKVUS_00010 [Saprospiraceae bacterium]